MIFTKFIKSVLWPDQTQPKKSGNVSRMDSSAPLINDGWPENHAVKETTVPKPVASENPYSEIKKTINGSMVTFEGTYQGKPIRVRIFNESHLEIKR